MKEKDTP